MNALELAQRQRELLGNIAKAVNPYRQAVADASARLERENEQIEQSQTQERQRIKEERKQKTEITYNTPAKDEKEEKRREEFRQRVQREIAAKRSTITPPRGLTTIEGVKREINRLSSTKINVDSPIEWAIAIFMFLVTLVSACGLVYSLAGEGGIWVWLVAFIVNATILYALVRRSNKKLEPALVNRFVLLHSLYDRWLELVDEQAGAQRAEAQERYDQAFAQAKGQMLAAVGQSRPAIAEFGALAEQASPSWQSEAWRQWEPARVGPGAVRLGTFKMTEV